MKIDVKKRALRVFLLVLVLTLAMACATACTPPPELPVESSSDSIPETPEETPAETPAAVKEAIALIKDGKCGYTIVRPELASDELKTTIIGLKNDLGKLMDSGTPVIAEDWLNPFTNQQPGELEILVGNCNRDETRAALTGLKYNDWTVDIVGKKLIIAGFTEEATFKALEYFYDNFMDTAEKGEDLNFTPEDCYTGKAEYSIDDITVSGSSLSGYSIVIPSLCGMTEKAAAEELSRYLSEMTGYFINVVKDTANESDKEILVGKTNRAASKKVLDTLLYDDSAMAVDGEKIVLLGYLPENTVKVCTALKDMVVRAAATTKKMELTADDGFEIRHEYAAEAIILNGKNVREYSIVYPQDNELCRMVANGINKALISKIGVSLEVVSDKTAKNTEYEILIGDTNRTKAGGEAEGLLSSYVGGGTDGLIASSDKYVLICGGEDGGFGTAVAQFIEKLVPEGISGVSTVELASKETFTVSTEEIRVMSYNILTWPTASRLDEIVAIIRACEPDVIGMQEAVPSALAALKTKIGDTYDCVYLERDRASGESTPIWYNKNKYTLIESGSGWLSDTPDVMSKFPESEYVRVYVYVVLESKETGARFFHVNTHLDFENAQRKQTGKLLALTSKFSYLPMFYTADWNFTPNSESYNAMHSAGYMDASVLTSNVHGSGTFVGSTSEIDFCFTSVLSTSVSSYRVIDEHPYSDTASDHYPIVIDLNIVK